MQSETHQSISSQQDTLVTDPDEIIAVLSEFEEALNNHLNISIMGRYGSISVAKELEPPLNNGAIGSAKVRLEYSPERVIADKLEADEFMGAANLVRGSVNNRGVAITVRINYEKILANRNNPTAISTVCGRLIIGAVSVIDHCDYPFDITGLST